MRAGGVIQTIARKPGFGWICQTSIVYDAGLSVPILLSQTGQDDLDVL
jgi:hypothetical protein